jgi:hypothetical protein
MLKDTDYGHGNDEINTLYSAYKISTTGTSVLSVAYHDPEVRYSGKVHKMKKHHATRPNFWIRICHCYMYFNQLTKTVYASC